MFLLCFPDTFITDKKIGGDRKWQRTWRVVRPRPPERSDFTTYKIIGVDHHRKKVETFCMMVRILGHGITKISEGDTNPDSHGDEHGGLSTVISKTQEKLVGIESDKLPRFPWDLGVRLVSRLFHLMMT
jgi:hypothetical protein